MSIRDPARLWHYTGQQGFLGILASQALWASKVQYQNDEREFLLTIEMAQSLIHATPSWGVHDSVINDLLQSLDQSVLGRQGVNVCTASLTENGDILSQWRGYCRPGDGLSVGFSYDALSTAAGAAGWTLVPCIYGEDEQRRAIEHEVSGVLAWLTSESRHREPPGASWGPIQQAARDCALRIMALAPTFKHASFREEQEWRLVSPPQRYGDMSYRPGKHSLIPYVRFPLTLPSVDCLKDPIVMVGPTTHIDLAVDAVGGALAASKVPEYEVKKTKVSYRDW